MSRQIADRLRCFRKRGLPSCGRREPPTESSRVFTELFWFGSRLLLTGLIVSLLVAQPVAAQASNPVCADGGGTLQNMIEGFIQLTTALGLMGLLVVWQADELAEMFAFGPKRKRGIRDHKRNALKSATVLVLLGPMFTMAGSVMDLPIAQCVDLIPF